MVSKNKNFKFAAFEVVKLSLIGLNYRLGLLVVNFISSLSKHPLPKGKSYRLLFSKIKGKLTKNISYSIARNISFHLNIIILINMMKDGSFVKGLFSGVKSNLASGVRILELLVFSIRVLILAMQLVVFSIEVSGAAILLKSLMKHQHKLANPQNSSISLTDFGSGQVLTVLILFSFIHIS